jgi:peroxiredoxin
MKKSAIFSIGLFMALGSHLFPSLQTQVPDVIRIPMSRIDNIVLGVGMGITFDKEEVAKALAKTPVKLPDPFPPGAKVGFNYEDDFFVICEKPEGHETVYLTVDANMNHDLRDDAKVEVPKGEKPGDGVIIKIKRVYPGPQPKEAWLPYRFAYSQRNNKAGEIETDIFLTPAYRMEGTFQFQGRDYVIQLNDFNVLGQFDKSNLSRGTVLRVYPKDDAKNALSPLWGYELIPLRDDFYEVRDEALDGSWVELARNTLPHTAIGRTIPDFLLTDTERKTLRLSDYRGRYLLLDFWFSGCVPCIREFPNVKKTIEKYSDQPLSVVGINLDSEKRLDMARKVIADYALPWRQVLEGKGYFLPIYQILGLLPELRMSFPLYVAIDPVGVVRYATNDFHKMERFLEYAFTEEKSRRETLFIPLVSANRSHESAPLPVDFDSESLKSLLQNPKLKLPDDLPKEARIGRLPNDTILIVRPASTADRIIVRLDNNRDLDLTNDKDKEIPILERFPTKSDEATRFDVTITFASGGMRFFPFRIFAKISPAKTPENRPEIFYIGYEEECSGSFFWGDEVYEVHIIDPTSDAMFTAADTEFPKFLTLKKKQGSVWIDVYSGTSKIPIGGQFFRLRHVHEDGRLIELEIENQPPVR